MSSVYMRGLLFLLIILLACSCRSDPEDRYVWIYQADPISEVRDAINAGDYRFMGVKGTTLAVPGLKKSCIDISNDVNVIEGTSEIITSYEQAKFQAVSSVYADYYNYMMKKYLEGEGLFTCIE